MDQIKSCANIISASAALFVLAIVVFYTDTARDYSVSSFHSTRSVISLPVPAVKLHRIIGVPDYIKAVSGRSADHRRNERSRNARSTAIGKIKRLGTEDELARARAAILAAVFTPNSANSAALDENEIDVPAAASVYRNPRAFFRSYMEMERRFKVYVYTDGELPFFHSGPCKDIYAIEGRFIREMEHGFQKFRTTDPNRAHVFFMPFSVVWMVQYLFVPHVYYDRSPVEQCVTDYVTLVSTKYPFWNRTRGADHFMLSCHDWAPIASEGNAQLYNNSIRALCNANTSEGFKPQKDVSLPEIALYHGNISPKLLHPPPHNASRPHLSFFAGGLHGPIRPILLHHWKNQDPEMQVHEYLPKDKDYEAFLLESKFCLCPSGYEVASPRIVEAIYAECVPVILSENYVLPFSDVLRWEAFSVQVETSEIPRLKEILTAVSENEYQKLRMGLREVRKHFMVNQPAKRYDVLHMILHSIWLRRINAKIS